MSDVKSQVISIIVDKLGVDEREAVKKWVREMTEAGLIQEIEHLK